jgi:MoaA/NifB/PqqE/SkfB family radical SAM enzyme
MPYQDWICWLRQFKNPLNIDITGGEPLIYAGIDQIIKEVDANHRWAMTTNLESNQWEVLTEKFKNCVIINISLHDVKTFKDVIEKAKEIEGVGNQIGFNVVSGVIDLRYEIEYLINNGYAVNYTPYMPFMGYDKYRTEDEWQCDGGKNSLFVAPNGDVYRCWTEIKCVPYIKPIGNIKDGFFGGDCGVCNLSCEEPQRLGYCGMKVISQNGVKL